VRASIGTFITEAQHIQSSIVLGQRPLLPTTMATYTEAMNEFTKNANAFIEQLPLLNKAPNA